MNPHTISERTEIVKILMGGSEFEGIESPALMAASEVRNDNDYGWVVQVGKWTIRHDTDPKTREEEPWCMWAEFEGMNDAFEVDAHPHDSNKSWTVFEHWAAYFRVVVREREET